MRWKQKSHLIIEVALKIWMGGVSIISGSLSGAQGAFPARQISLYYCRERDVLSMKIILSDGITRIYQIY